MKVFLLYKIFSMKKNFFITVYITFLLACNNNGQLSFKTGMATQKRTDTTTNAAIGPSAKILSEIYRGTLPCADCSGINTELTLQHHPNAAGGTYLLKETYVGAKSNNDSTVETKGNWTTVRGNATDPDATVIELTPDKHVEERFFILKKNKLLMLDRQLKEIISKLNYALNKK